MKLYALGAVLIASLWLGWPQDVGQPGVGGDTPSHGQPGVVAPGTESIYASATACWSFNDPTDLGNDDCTNTYDLTEVNTPTATGGALGYAMKAESASSQFAQASDSNDTDIGDGVSWGVAGWIRTNGTDLRVPFAKGDSTPNTSGEWDSYYTLGGVFTCRLHDGTNVKSDTAGTITDGAREFVHCRYNATTNALEAGNDGSWSGSATTTLSDGAPQAKGFSVAAQDGGGGPMNGTIGPVYWYRSASGGDVLTDALATSLYNSGKGKLCSELTAAEQVNLVSCWNMTEDGGPYVDSIGSNNLTGVNTPTRAAGLVERSDSGMSVNLVAASSQHLTSASWVTPDSYTIAGWMNAGAFNTGGMIGAIGTWPNSVQFAFYESTNNTYRHLVGDGSSFVSATALSDGSGTLWANLGWTHVCGYFSAADKKPHIKINDRTPDDSAAPSALSGTPYRTAATLKVGLNGGPNYPTGVYDNIAIWPDSDVTHCTDSFNSGVGTFYAAYWDALFNDGLRFAWSERPETRRIYVR